MNLAQSMNSTGFFQLNFSGQNDPTQMHSYFMIQWLSTAHPLSSTINLTSLSKTLSIKTARDDEREIFEFPNLAFSLSQHLALTFREIKNGGRKSKAVNKIPNVLKTKNICQIYDQLVCKFSSNKSSLSSAAGGGGRHSLELQLRKLWSKLPTNTSYLKKMQETNGTISHTWKEVCNNGSQSKTRPHLF